MRADVKHSDISVILLKTYRGDITLSFAKFEREMIKERTAAGKAIAQLLPGCTEGRPKQITPDIIDQIKKGVSWEELGISRATWYRYK